MNTELFCPGCQKQYSETDNIPLLLTSCGHSICQNCVQSIIKQHKNGDCIITCPEDKHTVTLKKNSITQLPKNLVLIKIIGRKNEKILKDLGSSFETSEKKKKQSSGDSDMEGLLTDLNEQESISPIAKQQINRDAKTSQTDSLRDKQQQQKDVEKSTKGDQAGKKAQQKNDICLLHQKPLEIVCIKDLIKICASCAIFGQHKGHQFKSLEQISQQQNKFYNSIIDIMDQKIAITDHICNETAQKQLMGILGKKKQKLVTEINDRYNELYKEVKKNHQQTLLKLNEVIDSAEKQIHQLMKITPDVAQLCQKWEIQSLRIIGILEGPCEQDIFKMLFRGTFGAGQLLDNGLQIVEKLKLQEQDLIPSVEEILEQISLRKNESVLNSIKNYTLVSDKKQLNASRDQSFLNNLSKFSQKQIENNSRNFAYVDLSESKNMSYDVENQCQDSLLDIDDHSDYSKPQFTQIQEPKRQILDDSILSNGDHKKKKIDNSSVPVNEDKKSKTVVMKKLGSMLGSEKIDKPKKPGKSVRFRLPEKYQKIVDGIKNQTLDIVDMTNAQLGDQNIQSICELIKNKSKIKAVKLIRNKLSDNCIKHIINNFDNISTLNLSQNYLTDTTLDIIAEHIEMLPKLKSLILSQNKIIERKHKTKIDKLKKLGLAISV